MGEVGQTEKKKKKHTSLACCAVSIDFLFGCIDALHVFFVQVYRSVVQI